MNVKTLDSEWEIPCEEITFVSKTPIATGAFSKIYRGIWRGLDVAIKVLNEELQVEVFRELHILTLVHHPNIVLFLGYSKMGEKIALIMEWFENGDLLHFLRRPKRFPLKYRDRMRLSKDIVMALTYLHLRFPTSIVHRDLKPRNCLVTQDGHCKIADFGISKKIYKSDSSSSLLVETKSPYLSLDNSVGNVGTLRYMAPEIIHPLEQEQQRQVRKSKDLDIYSLSMVLFLIWEDQEAFCDVMNIDEFYQCLQEGYRPSFRYTPHRLRKLIRMCWDENPSKRPSSTEIQRLLNEASSIHGEEWRYNIYRYLFV
jgi:serine/threonine protein kinase